MYIKMYKKQQQKAPYLHSSTTSNLSGAKSSVSFAHYCEQRKSKRYLLPTAALSHVAAAVVIPCTR